MMNLDDLWPFQLTVGHSKDPSKGACLLDAVSWFEDGCLNDHPPCVSPILAVLGQVANDWSDNAERQELRRFIPLLPGTVNPVADEIRVEFLQYSVGKFSALWGPILSRNLYGPVVEFKLGIERHPEAAVNEIVGGLTNMVRAYREIRCCVLHPHHPITGPWGPQAAQEINRSMARVDYVSFKQDCARLARDCLEVGCAIMRPHREWDFGKIPEAVKAFERQRVVA
jgi:hypothetical protein